MIIAEITAPHFLQCGASFFNFIPLNFSALNTILYE